MFIDGRIRVPSVIFEVEVEVERLMGGVKER